MGFFRWGGPTTPSVAISFRLECGDTATSSRNNTHACSIGPRLCIDIMCAVCSLFLFCCASTSVYPRASADADQVIRLQTNEECTFFVDGREVVTGRLVRILVNDQEHRIRCAPEGYYPKEEFIQPPYDDRHVYGFTFMIGEQIAEEQDESSQVTAEASSDLHETNTDTLIDSPSPTTSSDDSSMGRFRVYILEPSDTFESRLNPLIATLQQSLTETGQISIATYQETRTELWDSIEASGASPMERHRLALEWANREAFDLVIGLSAVEISHNVLEISLSVFDALTSDLVQVFAETAPERDDLTPTVRLLAHRFNTWINQ